MEIFAIIIVILLVLILRTLNEIARKSRPWWSSADCNCTSEGPCEGHRYKGGWTPTGLVAWYKGQRIESRASALVRREEGRRGKVPEEGEDPDFDARLKRAMDEDKGG
jgi:hypothetical protein